jgi:hypothetical protein
MTYFTEGDEDDPVFEDFFEGLDFQEKYSDYQEKEDDQDPLYSAAIDKISSIMTIWYISGTQDKEGVESILKEMKSIEKEEEEEEEEELEAEPASNE